MIIISKYNPKWAEEFESIKSSLHEILGDLALRSGTIAHDHVPQGENDNPKLWEKFFFNGPEGQCRANIHIRVGGNPNQIYPLLFRD
jgi:GrpB-like predicted nucleotidyltransferase (UPF0157 family)